MQRKWQPHDVGAAYRFITGRWLPKRAAERGILGENRDTTLAKVFAKKPEDLGFSIAIRYLNLMGMLVFSTYPLFSMNQVWTAPFVGNSDRIQFSSGEAEGIYNAALAALDHPEMMRDYATPFSVVSDSVPLWMSLVGSDSLWPVWFRRINVPTKV